MPSEPPVQRRLAAVLAADIVGYSRLMGVDEVGTLRELKAQRREIIDPAIAGRHGRIVKTTGDGLLAEFGSAVDAVACAIAIQRGLATRNAAVPEDRRLVMRIGINVGDIIIERRDIFGDGVNVAARLETLCEPGGLCIAQSVYEQVRDKLPVTFADLGEQTVKNIARPVRSFGLSPSAVAAAPEIAGGTAAPGRRAAWIAAAILLVIVGAGAAWWTSRTPSGEGPVATAMPAPAPARATVAVLPLAALGEDNDYFADGLTEDIIAALGRFREISVISRAGVFAYKGKNPRPDEIGRDLKVRYVVEGSVRRTPERVRVSISLTDTARASVLWSDKYDADAKDIFAVQDQITRQISGALAVQVTGLELAMAAVKPPQTLEAYELVLRGRDFVTRGTRADNARARGAFQRAIDLDPSYARAYVGLGGVNVRAATQGWTDDASAALERAEDLARKAITLDERDPGAHALLADVSLYFGDYGRALAESKRAIELNGSDPDAYSTLTSVLLFTGDLTGSIVAGEQLLQFRPNLAPVETFHLATAYLLADRPGDAVRVLEEAQDRGRVNSAYAVAILAAAYAKIGRQEDAVHQAELVRDRFPTFSRQEFGSLLRDPDLREKLSRSLTAAGL